MANNRKVRGSSPRGTRNLCGARALGQPSFQTDSAAGLTLRRLTRRHTPRPDSCRFEGRRSLLSSVFSSQFEGRQSLLSSVYSSQRDKKAPEDQILAIHKHGGTCSYHQSFFHWVQMPSRERPGHCNTDGWNSGCLPIPWVS